MIAHLLIPIGHCYSLCCLFQSRVERGVTDLAVMVEDAKRGTEDREAALREQINAALLKVRRWVETRGAGGTGRGGEERDRGPRACAKGAHQRCAAEGEALGRGGAAGRVGRTNRERRRREGQRTARLL